MRKLAFIIATIFFVQTTLFSKNIPLKLYVYSGNLIAVNDSLIPILSIHTVDAFSQENIKILVDVNDTLSLWVVNKDNFPHDFRIKGMMGNISINPNDSSFIQWSFPKVGVYTYFDSLDYPKNTYLGLSGMIVVKDKIEKSFYWNIKEFDSKWNEQLIKGQSVNWTNYSPNYFTINGRSNPKIDLDPKARITGEVGDTLILYITNTGQSIHSLHLHGYHATILFSSKSPMHQGREKDTHPVFPMESIVLQIVPDKPGIYPVHDHNLVAASANNFYPNGMFTTMKITE